MKPPNFSPAEQAEYDAGAALKKEGKELPANSSAAARMGYEEYVGSPKAPATTIAKVDEGPTEIIAHRVAIQAQTDRPEPTVVPDDGKPVNVNAAVKITVLEPGVRYGVEGHGSKVEIDFNDVTEEALLAILVDRLEGEQTETGNFSRNAAKDVNKALDWLKERTKDKLNRLVPWPPTFTGGTA